MRFRLLMLLFLLLSMPLPYANLLAEQGLKAPIKLTFPLDCTLGKTCWTARYSDRLQGKGFADFQCGSRTQHNHLGTDFAIKNLGEMEKGVAVLAAAHGTVKTVRTNEPDISAHLLKPKVLKGKECGNGLVLEHENGWTTQYCHLKKGSIISKPGDVITAGQKLGEVGLSGFTEYPHMHFNVRKDGKRIDPFDGKPLSAQCNSNDGTYASLWNTHLEYEDMALVYTSLTSNAPNKDTRWSAQPEALSPNAPAILLTGRVFGAQKGDRWLLRILRPGGDVFFEHALTLDRDRQFQLQYAGKKKPKRGGSPGVWEGEITIIRQHENGTISQHKQTTSILIK